MNHENLTKKRGDNHEQNKAQVKDNCKEAKAGNLCSGQGPERLGVCETGNEVGYFLLNKNRREKC